MRNPLTPARECPMGVFDLTLETIVNGMQKVDATLWNDFMFYELMSGKVSVAQVKYNPEDKILHTTPVEYIEIPVGSMRRLYAANVSDNMNWLALSSKTRGSNAAMNPRRNQVIVENYPGELTIYDLATGSPQARLRFKSGAALVRFSLDGKKLFVLTAGQVTYAFDIDQLVTKAQKF